MEKSVLQHTDTIIFICLEVSEKFLSEKEEDAYLLQRSIKLEYSKYPKNWKINLVDIYSFELCSYLHMILEFNISEISLETLSVDTVSFHIFLIS